MHSTHSSLLITTLATALVAVSAADLAHADTELQSEMIAEVEGKDASLALLEFVMENYADQSCGAKRAKIIVQEIDEHSAEVTTTDQHAVPESDLLELARSLPANENVALLYSCNFSGDAFSGRLVSVSHVAHREKSGWTASIYRLTNSDAPAEPLPSRFTDVEVAYALAEASRQMNAIGPKVVSAGVRLDSIEVSKKVLIYNFTLVDRNASEVNGRKLRRAVKREIVQSVCDDEGHLVLFRSGVRYEYRYHGTDGKDITTITVALKDCE